MIRDKILLISLARSEFTLLKNVYQAIKLKHKTDFIISGSHFLKDFGEVQKNINNTEIKKIIKVNLFKKYSNPDPLTVFNIVFEKFKNIFKNKKYKAIIIVGDRYEALSVALASFMNSIPIIHYHGGEKTTGSNDDMYRFCISKLSSLHLVAHKDYKKRLIQIGENPKHIKIVGALGLDNLKNKNNISKLRIEENFKIKFSKTNLMINFHPCNEQSLILKNLLKSLKSFCGFSSIIFTSPAFEIGFQDIVYHIKKFKKKNKNVFYIKNFGHKYFSATMMHCDLIIGNSSSGILEAPFLSKSVINLGNRQFGRLMSKNIKSLDGLSSEEITKNINKMLKKKTKKSYLYGSGNTGKKSVDFIKKNIDKIEDIRMQKSFIDIKF